MWQVRSTQATQGRWEGQGKAGSRTVLVVYRTLGSYVGVGVHQIEFATTHSHTLTRPHAHFWPFFYPLTPPSFFWITLPGLPCFTQPARHISVSLSFSKTFIASLLSLACHGSAHQRAHHQVSPTVHRYARMVRLGSSTRSATARACKPRNRLATSLSITSYLLAR